MMTLRGRSCDSDGGDFVVLDAWDGEAQGFGFEVEGDFLFGVEQVDGFDSYA